MTAPDIVYTTVNLPPAFIGQAYEAAIAYKGNATAFTAQGLGTTVNGSGLPTGLTFDTTNAGSLRITGTPTGAASTAISSGTSLAGPNTYTFCVTATDTAGQVSRATNYSIVLYDSSQFPDRDTSTPTEAVKGDVETTFPTVQ